MLLSLKEIVKESSWAVLSLNMLINNKISKQTAKLVVHVQDMSSHYTLHFDENYYLSRIKHTL